MRGSSIIIRSLFPLTFHSANSAFRKLSFIILITTFLPSAQNFSDRRGCAASILPYIKLFPVSFKFFNKFKSYSPPTVEAVTIHRTSRKNNSVFKYVSNKAGQSSSPNMTHMLCFRDNQASPVQCFGVLKLLSCLISSAQNGMDFSPARLRIIRHCTLLHASMSWSACRRPRPSFGGTAIPRSQFRPWSDYRFPGEPFIYCTGADSFSHPARPSCLTRGIVAGSFLLL